MWIRDGLAEPRSIMMNSEKIAEAINQSLDTLAGHKGLQNALSRASRALERANEQASGTLKSVLSAMERTGNESATTVDLFKDAPRSLTQDPPHPHTPDERPFGPRPPTPHSALQYPRSCSQWLGRPSNRSPGRSH